MPVDGVLFDLDETLIDRTSSLARYARQLWRRIDGACALDEASFVARFKGLDGDGYVPRAQFFERLAELLDGRFDALALAEHYEDTAWELPIVMPGAFDGLRRLANAGISIGVVTNGSTSTQTRKLENSGLIEMIDTYMISESFGARKPEPSIFRAVCGRLRVDPMRCWLVGDHPEYDVLGAHGVGLKTVWLERQVPWPDDQPRVYETRVAELGDAFSFLISRTGR